MSDFQCQLCASKLTRTFVDLGMSPLCETYIAKDKLNVPEVFYPLHTYVCETCFLVQVPEHVAPNDIYHEYPYFSSYSDSWLSHARNYCETMIQRLSLSTDSMVVEIASNDGYLLKNFVQSGIPCLGVEPAGNVAAAAQNAGVETHVAFFGQATAEELVDTQGKADLIIGNNVLAHVPDMNDFVAGMKILLSENGVITVEFPHLLKLMQDNQFDTIYHEHFSYLSFFVTQRLFAQHDLTIFDVEELSTHGGSLRIFASHSYNTALQISANVDRLIQQEREFGVQNLSTYDQFKQQVEKTKNTLLTFLITAKQQGKKVVGYGAPGKGNTLLNYCGIRQDLLSYTVDRSPHKQGKFTPGTRIPIYSPEHIFTTQPDYVLILPWNLADEIMEQMQAINQWGGKFVIPIPTVRIKE